MDEEKVPKAIQERYDAIAALTDEVCNEHLNAEYAQLSRKLAAALARKRPSPLAWMFEVNGIIMDARAAPREIQEELFRRGMIPYIPAEREKGS